MVIKNYSREQKKELFKLVSIFRPRKKFQKLLWKNVTSSFNNCYSLYTLAL